MSGNLQVPRPGTTGYETRKAQPLTSAIHRVHARLIPMPDKAGRTQNCQACHPTHWQEPYRNEFTANPYQVIDERGNPRFSKGDLRLSGGGCYLRRDAHTNPAVRPPFFLNSIGRWYLNEVSLKDEEGKSIEKMRGLYCTHCHNLLSRELYRYDDLRDSTLQKGKTLRNQSLEDIVRAVAGGDTKRFKQYFADPVVGAEGEPLHTYYDSRDSAVLGRLARDGGKAKLSAWNSSEGDPIPYSAVSGGSDAWLSPGEPHCADCHLAPFVESEGGKYLPIDQPGKYSLYRYSKAHGRLACQSCHQSVHGLYPVRHESSEETVDLTSYEQALQFSPDGKYAGPVTCAACHTVSGKGVAVQLNGTEYINDYWASVVLIHSMREGDQNLSISELMKKYPYSISREVVSRGWK